MGINCANLVDPEVAFNHLINCLKFNPKFQDLEFPQHELTNIDDLRFFANKLYMEALSRNTKDGTLLNALGVLKYLDRDYKTAEVYWIQAMRENPTDHQLWNRIGACKHNLGFYDEAIPFYH